MASNRMSLIKEKAWSARARATSATGWMMAYAKDVAYLLEAHYALREALWAYIGEQEGYAKGQTTTTTALRKILEEVSDAGHPG